MKLTRKGRITAVLIAVILVAFVATGIIVSWLVAGLFLVILAIGMLVTLVIYAINDKGADFDDSPFNHNTHVYDKRLEDKN